jgi:hypothetical protein
MNEGSENFFQFQKDEKGGVCNKMYYIYFFLFRQKSGIIIQLLVELILSLVPISIFLLV